MFLRFLASNANSCWSVTKAPSQNGTENRRWRGNSLKLVTHDRATYTRVNARDVYEQTISWQVPPSDLWGSSMPTISSTATFYILNVNAADKLIAVNFEISQSRHDHIHTTHNWLSCYSQCLMFRNSCSMSKQLSGQTNTRYKSKVNTEKNLNANPIRYGTKTCLKHQKKRQTKIICRQAQFCPLQVI